MNNLSTYLIFKLSGQFFGFQIMSVKEVIETKEITQIPLSPDFLEGIINLRGHAVPVVNLKQKLNIIEKSEKQDNYIVILEVNLNGEDSLFGAIVDDVKDVIEIESEKISAPPSLGLNINPKFIHGIGKMGEEFFLIINVERLFSIEELNEISNIGESN